MPTQSLPQLSLHSNQFFHATSQNNIGRKWLNQRWMDATQQTIEKNRSHFNESENILIFQLQQENFSRKNWKKSLVDPP